MSANSWKILILASALFVALGSVLVWIIIRLVRSNRDQTLAMGPLVSEQELTIRKPGELVLMVETPRFGSDHRNFQFQILEKATGQITNMKYDFARAQGAVYGVTTMRVPIGRMIAERAGPYRVQVTGLQAGKDYSRSRIFLSRPYLGRMILQIIGIVFCAVAMLVSLLLALWQVLPLERG